MKGVASLMRWAADRVDPPRHQPRSATYLTAQSVFTADERLEAQRREDAMSLVDDETQGYLLFTIRDKGTFSKIELKAALFDSMWPPICESIEKVLDEAQSRYGMTPLSRGARR